MNSGFILLDKEVGISSAKALYGIKRTFPKGTKIGHAGTLDPFASGLLIVGIGKATRTIEYVMGMNKTYEFTIEWGKATDTNDLTGEIIHSCKKIPNLSEIKKVLPEFCGTILQKPPKYSAIHVNGRRAYDLARDRIEFDLQPRQVNIIKLQILSHENHNVKLLMECSKGCYVRSVANDLANALGTYGHVTQLRRTKIGNFNVENSSMKLLEIYEILKYPVIAITNDIAQKIKHGILPTININERTFIQNKELNILLVAEKINSEVKIKRIF